MSGPIPKTYHCLVFACLCTVHFCILHARRVSFPEKERRKGIFSTKQDVGNGAEKTWDKTVDLMARL